MKRSWLAAGTALPALLTVALMGCRQTPNGAGDTVAADGVAPDALAAELSQPIQFPHNTHAGQWLMDCQYCHFSAERSVDAGIPPVETCIGCHREGIIDGRSQPQEVAKVRDYYDSGAPIPWMRIYKVADHVNFPHMRHVAAGLSCQTCHGEVQEMGVLTEMDPAAGDLKMGWCVSCHVERGASRDCTVCHY